MKWPWSEAHTAVFRTNDAPTQGFEAHVGRKTTLRVQNIAYCGFRERTTVGQCNFKRVLRSPDVSALKLHTINCYNDKLLTFYFLFLYVHRAPRRFTW